MSTLRQDRIRDEEFEVNDPLHRAAEAADHHCAPAAEARMRPPLTGAWPHHLTEAYQALMERAYAAMPDGYIPPPDLAPLAYESSGPALARLAAAHLERHSAHSR
ncbi:hypothetical protein [Streptomyces sp. CO7]